jgi:hypothetical protein
MKKDRKNANELEFAKEVLGHQLSPEPIHIVDGDMRRAQTTVAPPQYLWGDSVVTSLRDEWIKPGKRFESVRHIHKKIGWDILNALPLMTICAPDLNHSGRVYQNTPTGLFVYLSPNLEFESQRTVDFTVAHEIAHVALGHHEPGNEQMSLDASRHRDRPAELAADALAQSWGFSSTKRSRFGKIVAFWVRHNT